MGRESKPSAITLATKNKANHKKKVNQATLSHESKPSDMGQI